MNGIQRLQRLVIVLEEVRDDPAKVREFDLSHWGVETPDCGTHLCAAGWGAIDPILHAEGLSLVPDVERQSQEGHPKKKFLKLAFGEADHMKAARAFFEINHSAATYLFDPGFYPDGGKTDIAVVIDRIKERVTDPAKQDDDIEELHGQ